MNDKCCEKKIHFRLTGDEKRWILYDVGNSAFTLLTATILPIYFNYLGEAAGLTSVQYLAYWGYAVSVTTLIVAFLGPVLGTLADTRDFKKRIFMITMAAGAAGCVVLGLLSQWMLFLIVFVIAKAGYSFSLIFYDSMLTDVTTPERMSRVSASGYAWGYIGSCVPFIMCLALVLGGESVGISMRLSMALAFGIVALWWVLMTLPLLKNYRQRFFVECPENPVQESFRRLRRTLFNIKNEKKIFLFLLAFFFYIDGVYTIIDMATAYGAALGLDSAGLLLALLVTQIVAFPFAIFFGRLSRRYSLHKLIALCIIGYFGIALFAVFLKTQPQFWILAVLVGMFQGGIQALSRAYFARIIPPKQSGEYFGFMDICGKGASFFGTVMVSAVSQITGNISYGVGMIAVLFVVGLVLFLRAEQTEAANE